MKQSNKLVLIQTQLKAPKSNYNSFGKYNYRSCEDILEALKPLLADHNCTLTLSDNIMTANEITYINVSVVLQDNDSECTWNVCAQAGVDIHRKGMDIAQCFGSSSSYARKYALAGLFLLDDTKDADATNQHDEKPIEKPNFIKTDDERPWLNKGEPLMKAKEYLRNGGTIKDIEKKYKISKEIRSILEAEITPMKPQPQSIVGTGLNGDAANMFNDQFETPF